MRVPAQVNQGNDTTVDKAAFTKPRFSQLPFKATRKRPVPVTDTFFCVPRLLAHESFRCTSEAEVLIALSSVTFYCTCLSLPADVLWGLFVTHSFLPHGRGYICLGSWLMGRLSLRLLVSRSTKQNLFFRQEILRKRAGGEVTSSQGLRTFPL